MILIIDMNWKKDSLGYYEFVLPIISITKRLDDCVTKHYLKVNGEDISRCDRIILSGTTIRDTATLNQPEKFQWLKEAEKPILGICAGMETIGIVFGAPLVKCLEIGMTEITTLRKNPLFIGDYKAYSLHSYCVDSSETFEVLAKSAKCIQVIKHKLRPIYGILFHPEVRNSDIIRRFAQLDSN